MTKPNLDLPAVDEIDFEVRELPKKEIKGVERMALEKRFNFLENRNNEVKEENLILENKIYEMEKVISKFRKEVDQKEQLYKRLKRIFDFITKVNYNDRKKKEYYKLLNLWLLKKRNTEIKDLPEIKQKIAQLEGKNKNLLEVNEGLEEELKQVSGSLLNLKSEFDSKKEYFNEQDKKVYEIKKKAIRSLTNYQAIKEKSEQIEQRYKEVLVRNSLLEGKTKEHLTLLKQLKDRLLSERNSFSEQIEHLKKEHEKRVKTLIEQNTNTELGLRAQIKVLETKLDRQKKILKSKEMRDKEILSTINEKLKYLVEE